MTKSTGTTNLPSPMTTISSTPSIAFCATRENGCVRKAPQLKSPDALRRRIDEANRYVPLEYLALSPQGGSSSVAAGNLLSWDEQRRKLELLVRTARQI